MKKSKEKTVLFNELHQKYHKDLYRYAYKLTSNKEEAEDVIQEALLRAWSGLDSLKDINSIKSWLLTIVKREFLRKLETKKKQKEDSFEETEFFLSSPIDLEKKSELNEVLKVLLMLEEDYQQVMLLQTIYGFKTKEISQKLKINENTISTRLFRGRKQLKELLNKKIKKERKIVEFELDLY